MPNPRKPEKETITICAYCGVGCGFKAETIGNEIVRMTPWKEGKANHGHSCVKAHKVEALNNVNLSEYIYNIFLGTSLPDNILLREFPGFILIILYFAALPPILAKTVFRKTYNSMGFIRFNIMANLLLFMAALPIKMVMRWVLNLKYIVAIPEYFFNI